MDILAAVSRVPQQPFSIETLRLDEPREDEVRVRIAGVGLAARIVMDQLQEIAQIQRMLQVLAAADAVAVNEK